MQFRISDDVQVNRQKLKAKRKQNGRTSGRSLKMAFILYDFELIVPHTSVMKSSWTRSRCENTMQTAKLFDEKYYETVTINYKQNKTEAFGRSSAAG
jgi:hypothetical protein